MFSLKGPWVTNTNTPQSPSEQMDAVDAFSSPPENPPETSTPEEPEKPSDIHVPTSTPISAVCGDASLDRESSEKKPGM